MKLHQAKHRLDVHHSDLSGSVFDDVNLAGLKITKANLAGASIGDSFLDGMTIDGIAVTELPAAWQAAQKGAGA